MLYFADVPPSGKEVIARLKKLGWSIVHQRGSHVKLRKDRQLVIVPIHGSKDLGIGLIRAIERQTGEKLQ